MATPPEPEQVYAGDRRAWRDWLQENHRTARHVWLILAHKGSRMPSVTYEEAVEEALCFGWIDAKAHKLDDESSLLFFTRRSPKSTWSAFNRERAERMIRQGLMTEAGLEMIALAKKSGTWTASEEVRRSVVPSDLREALGGEPAADTNFSAFPPSSKRIILEWILNAKRPDTRKKRIEETVRLAKENIRANHSRQTSPRNDAGRPAHDGSGR
jgi:uncharacterized protein YdeI (YjbR/CyaY-like superfamily)